MSAALRCNTYPVIHKQRALFTRNLVTPCVEITALRVWFMNWKAELSLSYAASKAQIFQEQSLWRTQKDTLLIFDTRYLKYVLYSSEEDYRAIHVTTHMMFWYGF